MKIRLPYETMDWVMRNKGQLSMEQFVVVKLNHLAKLNSKKEEQHDEESNRIKS